VFRQSDVVRSLEMVDPVSFMFGSDGFYSRDLQFCLCLDLTVYIPEISSCVLVTSPLIE
jgi:hypothetical protein